MTEQQKHMLQQALEALSNAYCEKKKYYIAANDYATAKIEDVLALKRRKSRKSGRLRQRIFWESERRNDTATTRHPERSD